MYTDMFQVHRAVRKEVVEDSSSEEEDEEEEQKPVEQKPVEQKVYEGCVHPFIHTPEVNRTLPGSVDGNRYEPRVMGTRRDQDTAHQLALLPTVKLIEVKSGEQEEDVQEHFGDGGLMDWVRSKKGGSAPVKPEVVEKLSTLAVANAKDTEPVFQTPAEDAEPRAESVPGNHPIASDSPIEDVAPRQDAEKRKATLERAEGLLEKVRAMREKMEAQAANEGVVPVGVTQPIPSDPIQENLDASPAPEGLSARFTSTPVKSAYPAEPRGKEVLNPTPKHAGMSSMAGCRFLPSPTCSPDFPYFTGANIGMAGGSTMFRCSTSESAEDDRAQAVATIGEGKVKRVDVVSRGRHYSAKPGIQVMGGGGSGAILDVIWNPRDGTVDEVRVRSGGNGYYETPKILIDVPGVSDQCYLCCSSREGFVSK